MLTEERHTFILNELKQANIVKTQDLMNALNSSESTIRRDLQHLEEAGELTRIHGGAKRIYQLDSEQSIQEKSVKNNQEKIAIAKLAASFIEDNDVIYLDAGTTTLAMIEFINKWNITVVTNGIVHASLLTDKEINTILLGGKVKPSTKAIVGAPSQNELQKYQFNKSFLGMNGIDATFGCTTPDPEEAALKTIAHQHSATAYVVADHTKWDKVHFVNVCGIEEVILITDSCHKDLAPYKTKTTIWEAKQ